MRTNQLDNYVVQLNRGGVEHFALYVWKPEEEKHRKVAEIDSCTLEAAWNYFIKVLNPIQEPCPVIALPDPIRDRDALWCKALICSLDTYQMQSVLEQFHRLRQQ